MEHVYVQVSCLWFLGGYHFWLTATGLEVTRIVAPFSPQCLFKSDSNNGPSPGHFNLVSNGVTSVQVFYFMVSWQVPYLAKGCRPDFNNGLGADLNSGPNLTPRHLFTSNLNNGPSPGHSNTELQTLIIAHKLF